MKLLEVGEKGSAGAALQLISNLVADYHSRVTAANLKYMALLVLSSDYI